MANNKKEEKETDWGTALKNIGNAIEIFGDLITVFGGSKGSSNKK